MWCRGGSIGTMYKFLYFSVLVAYCFGAEVINKQIVNKNVDRSIDLASQLVKITTTITLENTGKDSVSRFLIAKESNKFDAAYFNVKDLKYGLVEGDVPGYKGKQFCYVDFKQPLEGGRTTTVVLEEVLTRSIIPYPSSITQKDKQFVQYFGNHYFYSPYVTIKQKTEVLLASRNIENYSKLKPVSLTDATITYGTYTNIEPFSIDKLTVHYENNAPFLTVKRLDRSIELSHWGNIAIEENIEILHTGAKLKGPFSRYDYQRDTGSVHHSIKSYRTILPASAHSIYYRDSNGNISTSTVRLRKEWTELELRPRFPLFGGWRSSYLLGYSIPSYQYLFKKSTGQYILNIRLLDHVFDDMHVEELETSVVLPVGVSNIEVVYPYNLKRLPDGVTYKYLDNIGRAVVKFTKTNLVEQHIQDVVITYNWQPHLLLHEPVLLTVALFILFILVIIYVRLDFSLSKPEHSKKD